MGTGTYKFLLFKKQTPAILILPDVSKILKPNVILNLQVIIFSEKSKFF